MGLGFGLFDSFSYFCEADPCLLFSLRLSLTSFYMQYKTLADRLAAKLDITRDEVDALCDSLGEIVGKAGAELDSVSIPSFGTFEPRKRAERISVNPSSGVRMLIPPKVVLSFRPSALLRKRVRDLDVDDNSARATVPSENNKGNEGGL